MNEIKAIPTRYKGYHFRSRLEARWAVFFDALGIKWEYEPEGFDLGEFGYYLPDFYIPSIDTYVEIKPNIHFNCKNTRDFDNNLDFQLAFKKCGGFLLKTNKTIALCFGNPDEVGLLFSYACHYKNDVINDDFTVIDKLIPVVNDFMFISGFDYTKFQTHIKLNPRDYDRLFKNPDGIMFDINPSKDILDGDLYLCKILDCGNCCELPYTVSSKFGFITTVFMSSFIDSFKSARFEHGETGAT